jgi:hypothetical protein
LESGVFFTSTESEPAGVDSDILFRLAGSPVGDWIKCGCGTFAVRRCALGAQPRYDVLGSLTSQNHGQEEKELLCNKGRLDQWHSR